MWCWPHHTGASTAFEHAHCCKGFILHTPAQNDMPGRVKERVQLVFCVCSYGVKQTQNASDIFIFYILFYFLPNTKVDEINTNLKEEITPRLDELRGQKTHYLKWKANDGEENRLQKFCVAYSFTRAEETLNSSQGDTQELEEEQKALQTAKTDAEVSEVCGAPFGRHETQNESGNSHRRDGSQR